jgi:entericidin B
MARRETKEQDMRKLLIVAGVALLALAGCNTVKGAGKDVSAAGDVVQDEATDAQNSM